MKHTKRDSFPASAYLLFSCARTGPNEQQVDYELILPLGEVDCRGTFDRKGRKTYPKNHRLTWLDTDNRLHLPLGRTMIGTGNETYPFSRFNGGIDLPFRDGVHCGWDNAKLGNLPIYYKTPTGIYELSPQKPAP